MAGLDDQYRRIRAREDALRREPDLVWNRKETTLVQIYNGGSKPTTAPGRFVGHPLRLIGDPAEGAGAGYVVDLTRSMVVTVYGSVPPDGDVLIAERRDGHWIAERWTSSGGGGVVIAGCTCTSSPATLYMTSSKPLSNNQMLQSATLQYGTTPGCLSTLGLGASCYLSTTQFTDFATGDDFWYHLTCFLGYYVITRVYCYSHYGNPYRDIVLYRWLAGFPGNTCTPFSLTRGIIFPGGDSSCVVTISE